MNLTKFLAGCALTLSLVLVTSAVVAQDDTTMPPSDLTNPQAAFIYSHDFAISKGATAEWRKMEGVAFDTVNSNFYVAVTAVSKGMSDDKGDMQMTDNPCGAVFSGALDSGFDLAALKQVVVGGPYDESNADYACSPDSIAGADNLFADSKGNLWI